MGCVNSLSGFASSCDASVGGIKKVYLALKDEVSSITAVTGETAWGYTITMKNVTSPGTGTYKFKRFYVRRGSSSMTSTLTVDDANGVSYVSTDLVLNFAKMDHSKLAEIEKLTLGAADLVAIVEDANGNKWVLGKENPVLRSAATGQTGQAMGDANNYSITLNDTAASWPLPVNMTDEAFAAIVDEVA